MRIPYTPDTQRAWVDVDLDALVRNAESYRQRVGVPLLPMVKANGYGLGALAIATALAETGGVWGFGVATVEEARALHLSGIVAPILVFTPVAPPQVGAHEEVAARPTVGDLEGLRAWLAAGRGPFHVEIDTGMRRSGFPWNDLDQLHALAALLSGNDRFEGVFTHFHSAGDDPEATSEQWRRFHRVLEVVGRPRLVHVANSAGGGFGSSYAADLARPGIHLYGGHVPGLDSVPVAALRARVTAVRRVAAGDSVSYDATWTAPHATTIATLGIGYGDGVSRRLSNVGAVELLGQRLRIVGRVTMDQLMLDAGDLPVTIGDVATIFGGKVSLDEQAALAGTIPYELLTALGNRLPRRYQRMP